MNNYFCGWYIKCQNETQTVALIPAYHISNGVKTCSVQVITDDRSLNVEFPYDKMRTGKAWIQIGGNRFERNGVTLKLSGDGVSAFGRLSFEPFCPIRYDIMGPFKYVPFMECRHSVFSMKHKVTGSLIINGEIYKFTNDDCYVEGDRGHSFPKEYLWTQCFIPEGSIMVSVADIPFCGARFTGVIGVIHYRGREYRIGTYLGAKAVSVLDGEVVIQQGRKVLTVKCLEKKGSPLAAPVGGDMSRIIHETASCRVYFYFREDDKTVFEFESDRASFEYEYAR